MCTNMRAWCVLAVMGLDDLLGKALAVRCRALFWEASVGLLSQYCSNTVCTALLSFVYSSITCYFKSVMLIPIVYARLQGQTVPCYTRVLCPFNHCIDRRLCEESKLRIENDVFGS